MPYGKKAGRIGRRPVLLAFFAAFFAAAPFAVSAQEAETPEGMASSADVELQLSSRPEAKLRFIQHFSFPFLTGPGPLVRGNNIAATLGAEISPLAVSGLGEISWTPVAFFLLSGGGQVGSGWNLPVGDGIGLNKPEGDVPPAPGAPPRKSAIDGSAFDGLVWKAWGAGTLQFDLGAVIPGDWTHVLFQTRQEFRYAAYTRAADGEPWVFEKDDKENMNGWVYSGSYTVGYRMPGSPVLDTIAVMGEMRKFLYDTPGGDAWGESLGRWLLTGMINLSIHERFSLALAVQMRTRRNHGQYNLYNLDSYYQDLRLDEEAGSRHLHFYRAAAIMTYKVF